METESSTACSECPPLNFVLSSVQFTSFHHISVRANTLLFYALVIRVDCDLGTKILHALLISPDIVNVTFCRPALLCAFRNGSGAYCNCSQNGRRHQAQQLNPVSVTDTFCATLFLQTFPHLTLKSPIQKGILISVCLSVCLSACIMDVCNTCFFSCLIKNPQE